MPVAGGQLQNQLRIADCGFCQPTLDRHFALGRTFSQSAIRDPQSASVFNPQSAIRN